jgi:2',3'-cyclic-nucleotide 2'-phosphodiesterase (5'-nucleotidase family)
VVDGGQEASGIAGKIAPSTVITVNGERIGFVGAVTPTLAQITSTGSLDIFPANFTNDAAGLEALAARIQPEIDALVANGINKIVVLSHMQNLDVERALAPLLDGVDIIVGGGSNSLLADGDDFIRDGDTTADTYPISLLTSSGEPVLLVNTEADYKYLGRLVVEFDAQGLVLTDSIDPAESGAWAAVTEITDDLLMAQPIAEVKEVVDVIRIILRELDGSAFGITEVFLDGRREFVRSRETNLGNLSADANLWYGQQMVDTNPPIVSVKNGGGIRAAIGQVVSPAGSTSVEDLQLLPPAANDFGKPEGGISQLDIQTAFAFNNGLALVTMTAAELHDLVEEMIKGSFTHTAGLRLDFDPEGNARTDGDANQGSSGVTDGERVRKLQVVVDPDAANDAERFDLIVENGTLQGDPTRTFRVIALDFLAGCAETNDGSESCGSGWPFNNLTNPEYAELADPGLAANDPGKTGFSPTGGEQDAFSEYLQEFHSPELGGTAYNVPFDVNERLIPLETAQ